MSSASCYIYPSITIQHKYARMIRYLPHGIAQETLQIRIGLENRVDIQRSQPEEVASLATRPKKLVEWQRVGGSKTTNKHRSIHSQCQSSQDTNKVFKAFHELRTIGILLSPIHHYQNTGAVQRATHFLQISGGNIRRQRKWLLRFLEFSKKFAPSRSRRWKELIDHSQ